MSLIYVWKPAGLANGEADELFDRALKTQVELYQQAFGYRFTAQFRRVGSVLVGQMTYDIGVDGWQPWVEQNHVGIVWAGICETYLGASKHETLIADAVATIEQHPARLASWEGRFAACSWRTDDQVVLTTGATESPTLWYADGPHGWAAGSRALPLLELVGRSAELDQDAAGLYVAFGFLIGPGALFRGAKRLPSRRQVRLRAGEQPHVQTYVSLGEYLQEGADHRWPQTVAQTAEHLSARIKRQIAHSRDPHLLLTGGRDSRCIAAAAVKAGYTGNAHTSGASDSIEVQLAQRVAERLGIDHEQMIPGNGDSPLRPMASAEGAVHLWSRISEGVETVRHAVPFPAFFRRQLPFPSRRQQVFHGLHMFGTLARTQAHDLNAAFEPQTGRAIMEQRIGGSSELRARIMPALEEVYAWVDAEANGIHLSLGQWLQLVYWQTKCLQWGEDMMSVKDLIDWHWTPLLDRRIIQAGWPLKAEYKTSKRLFREMTLYAAPSLKGIPYDIDLAGTNNAWVKFAQRVEKKLDRFVSISLTRQPRISHSDQIPVDQYLHQFWNTTLFAAGDHAWMSIVDAEYVQHMIVKNPVYDMLWRIATVELAMAARSYCPTA